MSIQPQPHRTPTRRKFLKQCGAAAATWATASIVRGATGANDRVRFALIGAGSRGMEIFQKAMRCANVEAVAVADLYSRRRDAAKKVAPKIAVYQDFRKLLDDKSIDAVLIATPQHQHALNFVPAIQARKDVYQEKTMAFTPDHAKRMRAALAGSKRVVQVGMQMSSGSGIGEVRRHTAGDRLGQLNMIESHHFRNAAYGGWKRKLPADCTEQNVDWNMFQGEAERHSFDANRFMNWRFFWDYSGGNFFENMVHQVGFWYKSLRLEIPESVTTTGANYHSREMEVPDTMQVTMRQSEKLMFVWTSMFTNSFFGETHDYLLGTSGTILHTDDDRVAVVTAPAELSPQAVLTSKQPPESAATAPAKQRDLSRDHLQNFFDCVRSRAETNAPFELGFRAAVACRMAVTSYRQQRTVRWDRDKEEIV